MDTKNNITEKPNVDDLKMHMPEGSLAMPDSPSEHRIANGPILVLLIVLLLLILGGMYFWYVKLNNQPFIPQSFTRPTAEQNNEPESTTAEAQVETMQAVSTSDEVNAIEADLESTNLDSLDTEIQTIENELDTGQ